MSVMKLQMSSLDSLPIEILHMIVDYFNPTDYAHDYQNALNILRLSQVNHSFYVLLHNPDFYKRLCQKYLSNNLPDSSTELQRDYFKALRDLEHRDTTHRRIRLAIRNDWIHVFNRLFDPTEYTYERESTYRNYVDEDSDTLWGEETMINRLFILAIQTGDIPIIDRLLDSGAYMDGYMQGCEYDALVLAIRWDHLDVVNHLLGRGGSYQERDDHPLVVSAECGNLILFNRFVELGEDITVRNNGALMMASQNGHTNIIERLIELKVDLTVRDNRALMEAVKHEKYEVISLLVRSGVNLTIRCLTKALKRGRLEMVAFLIKEGFDVRSDDNEALIYYITFICQYRIEPERSLGILRLLLEASADIKARNSEPLRIATKHNRRDLMKVLIDAGAEIHEDIYATAEEKSDQSVLKLVNEDSMGGITSHQSSNPGGNRCSIM